MRSFLFRCRRVTPRGVLAWSLHGASEHHRSARIPDTFSINGGTSTNGGNRPEGSDDRNPSNRLVADTGPVVRIATWNCRSALDRKLEVVDRINADVLAIQECSAESALYRRPGMTALWGAPSPSASKGVGIFCRAPWVAQPEVADPSMPWVLPATVRNAETGLQFLFLAVWANTKHGSPYASQLTAVLDAYADQLREGNCVIAGDMNASIQGPSREPHRNNLFRAKELGLVSAYHHANDCRHGSEADMTLRWIAPGGKARFYHCDFIFLPVRMAAGATCSVLTLFDADKPASDHQPVIADTPWVDVRAGFS